MAARPTAIPVSKSSSKRFVIVTKNSAPKCQNSAKNFSTVPGVAKRKTKKVPISDLTRVACPTVSIVPGRDAPPGRPRWGI